MFPEAILFKAERGLRAALLEAAQKERQSASEYVRRRLRAELQADGIELPPFDLSAYSDEAGRGFRSEAGRCSDVKPATIPI